MTETIDTTTIMIVVFFLEEEDDDEEYNLVNVELALFVAVSLLW